METFQEGLNNPKAKRSLVAFPMGYLGEEGIGRDKQEN